MVCNAQRLSSGHTRQTALSGLTGSVMNEAHLPSQVL
jgi:hypothetical protein